MTEPEASQPRTGRPRPDGTIEQDQRVLDHLRASGPLTKSSIAEALGLLPSRTYLSLYRLRHSNAVKRTRGERNEHVWSAVDTEPTVG